MSDTVQPWMIKFVLAREIPAGAVLDVAFVEFSTDAERDEIHVLPEGRKKIVVKLAKPQEITDRERRLIPRRIIALAKNAGIKHLAIDLCELEKAVRNCHEKLVEFLLANYSWDRKKEPKGGRDFVQEIFLISDESQTPFLESFARAEKIAMGVNKARDLSNERANVTTPKAFCEEAMRLAASLPIQIEVLKPRDMRERGMEGILAVGKGSANKPRLLIMKYMGAGAGKSPLVLIGKGVVYDSGGLAIKPPESMVDMHGDKSGGASVVGTILSAAMLGVRENIIVIVPLVENSISSRSFRNGDILNMSDGTTVEVINTDAEGRLILAEALLWAKQYSPQLVCTLATLTGAEAVALGHEQTGFFVRDNDTADVFADRLIGIGKRVGDPLWRLPLSEVHEAQVKSKVADLRNTGTLGRLAGASTAAAFLKHFAPHCPWVHLDMAGTMVAAEGEYLAHGSKGACVRFLLGLVESY